MNISSINFAKAGFKIEVNTGLSIKAEVICRDVNNRHFIKSIKVTYNSIPPQLLLKMGGLDTNFLTPLDLGSKIHSAIPPLRRGQLTPKLLDKYMSAFVKSLVCSTKQIVINLDDSTKAEILQHLSWATNMDSEWLHSEKGEGRIASKKNGFGYIMYCYSVAPGCNVYAQKMQTIAQSDLKKYSDTFNKKYDCQCRLIVGGNIEPNLLGSLEVSTPSV